MVSQVSPSNSSGEGTPSPPRGLVLKTKELLEGIYYSKGFRVAVFDFKELRRINI